MVCAFIAMKRGIGRGSVHNSSPPGMFVVEINMISNSASWVLDTGCGAHICNDLQSNLIMTAQHKRKVNNHENAQIWHARLGHISKDRIRRLVDSKSLEIDDLDHLPTCESCLKGKMTKKPFVGQSAMANENGILSQWTPPGTPQLNGVAERRNRTLLDMVRSMMSFLELPPSFWGQALETAVKLLNIAPSKNAVLLKKGFPSNNRHDEVLIEESSGEPPHDSTASFEPTVHTDGVPVLRRSTRESRVPERYGFVGLTSQLDNDPKTYGEVMSDIDSDKWLEAMKFEMDSMGSKQVWTLVDPPKGVRP
ncbi:UNVERIFIED_CONTAM: hypothetical protein Slati_1688900 [Sesamum latifolium]|uniref:Integrase catalytic domain-containing protein n=1 Tax=Sesamum latifolium TaxID=2727402 RepID=A0AAW2WVW4_9LAMI